MKAKILFTVIFLTVTALVWGQTQTVPKSKTDSLRENLQKYVQKTDTTFSGGLVSERAFNLFLQKKSSYYLSGASEVSISKLYATYSSDEDKFNFGVNFRNKSEDEKLRWMATPIVETNVKKSFTTLYKKDEWQSDIRIGGKFTMFFGGKLKYYGMNVTKDAKSSKKKYRHQETQMMIVRSMELVKINGKIDALEAAKKYTDGKTKIQFNNSLNDLEKLVNTKAKTKELQEEYDKTLTYITAIKENENKVINELVDKELDEPATLDEFKTQIATAEVNKLYESGSYNTFRNFWLSVWGFLPLTERKTYVAIDNTVSFDRKKLKLWEANLQGNGIWEYNNKISFYTAVGWKIFQNNTALADLMTPVEYYQYSQFPETATSNLAVLDNNKAYIGEYKEFVTNNFNVQIVASLSNTDKNGKEKLVTPGISVFVEKNIGEFSAMNLRFGVPLRFRGKSTPINIEPQILLKDITNYSSKAEREKPIIGINVGLPFSALFK
ncbi:hypothetical protein [Sphingobacterium anhuiense]|uniref:hypothetical protein n=1 Tax=Sphingobacterium anhuiense TaxID=493780 RepID=UPI003C2BDF79